MATGNGKLVVIIEYPINTDHYKSDKIIDCVLEDIELLKSGEAILTDFTEMVEHSSIKFCVREN